MQRRTLDILFSVGGVLLAGLLAILGLVLTSNANFADTYVRDQLSQQNITFKAVNAFTPEEAAKPCLVANAGKALVTGKQAECYANEFIGLHLQGIAGGKTYAELGDTQNQLKAQIATAKGAGQPTAELDAQLATATTQRETVFKGETLRGLLLTSFGFSTFGEKASQAATVAYISAWLLILLSIAGFAHALKTAPTVAVGEPVEPPRERLVKDVVGVRG